MKNAERQSPEQIRAFPEASHEVDFEARSRDEMYACVTATLCLQEYWKQKRAAWRIQEFYDDYFHPI